MNKEEFKKWLMSEFPGFQEQWESEENFHKENNEYTFHGLCSEFSHFFIDNVESIDDTKLDKLFKLVESWVTRDSSNKLDISNALCTCFLENIAKTKAGEKAKRFMGKESKEYFNNWNN